MNYKVCVVSNAKTGVIVGMHPIDYRNPQGIDAPTGFKVVPLPEQAVDEIEISQELAKLPFDELAKRYRVRNGRLVETGSSKK